VTERSDAATPLEALVAAVRACASSPDGMVPPAAILWPDPENQWLPLKDLLLQHLPELVVLGPYDPEARTGPAIWVRCVVDRTLAEPALPPDRIPVVYLPGVGRQALRAGEDCPGAIRPLVELLFRGTVWLQRGGHDWTVRAFLTSSQGLELDVARDRATCEALARALTEVAVTPVVQLRGRHLEAQDFDELLSTDVVRDLLRWMGEPAATRQRLGSERWGAFRSQCRQRFGLDPERDGEITAGERLGRAEGPWADVWQRFEEAPTAYPGVPELLRRARPMEILLDRSHWPGCNEEDEAVVRSTLVSVEGLPHNQACARVMDLEREHGRRRAWVWCRLGASPMAAALKPLNRLARVACSVPGGATPAEVAAGYVEGAWEGDAAGWEAVAQASPADETLIRAVVHALLGPWLDESARVLQRLVEVHPLPHHGQQEIPSVEPGGCLLFVDGLRYDVGRRLAQGLEARGFRVRVRHRWAALPTVTATAKAAATPVAGEVVGGELPEDFAPLLRAAGRAVDATELRVAIRAAGYQLVDEDAGEAPADDEARGWTETGVLDRRGHDLGEDLARQIEPEIDRLAERILRLFDAGWRSVRVVTDHGWLLLPGGLPRVDLPRHLTASRWSRCAVVAGQSQVAAMAVPWHWNPGRHFVTAPGAACFNASPSYAHGGVSIQECLIPDLLVERVETGATRALICSVAWRGMRCFVEASVSGGPVTADLRLERATGSSVAASPKELDAEGIASLLVKDDAYEASPLVLVLLDQDGRVLAQRETRVGVAS
jgi:hypothetical protein